MSGALDNVIKKYKLAVNSKSKDIRFSVEEIGNLIADVALLQNNNEILKDIQLTVKKLSAKEEVPTYQAPMMDGGKF